MKSLFLAALLTLLTAATFTAARAENIEVTITIIVPDGAVEDFRRWLDVVDPDGAGADYDLRLAQYARPQIIGRLQDDFAAYYRGLIQAQIEAQMTNATVIVFE